MLGGGNPVGGANPAGVGSTLNYIGNHAYGASGSIDVDNNVTTLMNFNTSNAYVIAEFHFVRFDSGEDDIQFVIEQNGEDIAAVETHSAQYRYNQIKILLEPFSKYIIKGQNTGGTASIGSGVTVVGRTYQ